MEVGRRPYVGRRCRLAGARARGHRRRTSVRLGHARGDRPTRPGAAGRSRRPTGCAARSRPLRQGSASPQWRGRSSHRSCPRTGRPTSRRCRWRAGPLLMEERPAAISEATRRAELPWGEVGGVEADIAGAALALFSAAALRRSGRPDSAVDHAAGGLARLDGIRAAQEGTPSRHLAAALAAEWITALVEACRTDDAREACAPMARQLRTTARPTRQIALLRPTRGGPLTRSRGSPSRAWAWLTCRPGRRPPTAAHEPRRRAAERGAGRR